MNTLLRPEEIDLIIKDPAQVRIQLNQPVDIEALELRYNQINKVEGKSFLLLFS